ncbi:uncharacterized protein Dvar_54300 [Desulfosarcina variabilis str. Montpellier]|uniref:hypothetical protein n=1 Tax=Desulfosarcina variabilis TaxID=2300 RepID=UPI003AFAFDBF
MELAVPKDVSKKDRWFFTNGWGIAEQQETTGDESVQTKPKGSRNNNFTFSAPIHPAQRRCENTEYA